MDKKKWKYRITLLAITVAVYWLLTDGFSSTFSQNLGITKGGSEDVIDFLRMDVNPVYVVVIIIIPILLKIVYDQKVKKPKVKIMKKTDIRKEKKSKLKK